MTKEMTKAEIGRQAMAEARVQKSREILFTAQLTMLKFAEIAKDVREKEDWKELGYDSWGAFCSDPEVYARSQKTVDEYISIYTHLVIDKKIKPEVLSGGGPNKMRKLNQLIEAGEDIDDWLPAYKTNGERDFCASADEKLKGKPAPDHVGNVIAKIRPCPLWDACEGKCKGGVDVKAWAKKDRGLM